MDTRQLYLDGSYWQMHPTWDAEDSSWKARQILEMVRRHNLKPATVCEVGCGAGEILRILKENMAEEVSFWGSDVSPDAMEICRKKETDRLHFECANIFSIEGVNFDLVLAIDVVEHVEDCFGLVRHIRSMGRYKIFHFPLDLSVQGILRGVPMYVRKTVGHIHYFTKETALELLRDTGYDVIDSFYTGSSVDLPPRRLISAVARLPRKLAFAVHKDLAVRILGGYSLLVLAA